MTTTNPPSWDKYKTLFSSILPYYKRAHHVAQHFIHTSWDALPNVLLFSPKGFPMSLFVHEIFVQKFGTCQRTLHHFENHDIPFVETPFSFEIDLLHPNIKSMDVVSDFVHMIISRANVLQNQRHIFILQNVDALWEERFTFRVLLERFSKNVLFFCTTTRISAIEPPLRSRFTSWTIPSLTKDEIQFTMTQLGKSVPPLLQDSRNLLQVMMIADMDPSTVTPTLCTFRYPPLANFFNKKWTLEDIRACAFKMCAYNITFADITQDLLTCMESMHTSAISTFIEKAANIEHVYVCTNGGRKPLYYEWLLHSALAAVRH